MNTVHPRTSLEQWLVLQVVVEAGSYARASEILHRSQSSLSYTTAQLQQRLGVQLLRTEGRRAVLTEVGSVLLAEAKTLLAGMGKLEALAGTLARGLEPRVRLSVESLFPKPLLFEALARFHETAESTYVELRETMRLDVAAELGEDRCDLCVGITIPSGYLGDPLLDVELIAVAAPSHRLHSVGRPLSRDDLMHEVFIALEDATAKSVASRSWLITNQRWTMSTVESAIGAVCSGMGFAWLPRHRIEEHLQTGSLKPLVLKTGGVRLVHLYLVHASARQAGPSTQGLAEAIQSVCASHPMA